MFIVQTSPQQGLNMLLMTGLRINLQSGSMRLCLPGRSLLQKDRLAAMEAARR